MPEAAVEVFVIAGLFSELLNPFGPVQFLKAAPVDVVLASNCKVLPLHIGLVLLSVGVAGGLGDTSVKGPASAEEQSLAVTVRCSYRPEVRFVMLRTPLSSELCVIVLLTPSCV